ncbi:MAG: hypothetical protein MZW92_16135 [Comamonadaceae bacterium]|nr:hypothetical protein [Comamonadaceae bacterium]
MRVGGGQQPAPGAVARHPDQGEPHRRGRRHRRGAGHGAGAERRRRDPDRGRDAGAAAARRWPPAPPACCSTTSTLAAHARGGGAQRRPARCWRSPAASQLDQLRDIAATGVRPHLDRQADQGRAGRRLLDARARASSERRAPASPACGGR